VVATGAIFAVGEAGAQQAGNEFPVGVDDTALQFRPAEITVSLGDTVVWDFAGSTTAHNVVSENESATDTKWKDFATPPATEGQFRYTFTQLGEYEYVCDLHRVQGMTGKVTVIAAPVATPEKTPRPIKTATPVVFATATPDHSRDTPAPSGKAAADKVAPVVSKMSVRGAGRRAARVKWTLSEAAELTFTVHRSGSRKTLRTVRVTGYPGSSALTIRGSKLKGGRYFVWINARDAAGNRSEAVRAVVRIAR
jgi:plastocyanin